MKNKNLYILIVVLLLLLILASIYLIFNTSKKKAPNTDYDSEKSGISKSINPENSTLNISIENSNKSNTTPKEEKKVEEKKIEEKQLSSFSTKIYNKENARQNNLKITGSKLNGHIVKKGEIFSFCNTLGPATSKEGYKESDIFDKDGNKKKGLGGGICQISTTLYNAILKNPNLEVIERHKHSNSVPYIKKGNDATVAYGSYDFKFKNNTQNDIKLFFDISDTSVTVRINELINLE